MARFLNFKNSDYHSGETFIDMPDADDRDSAMCYIRELYANQHPEYISLAVTNVMTLKTDRKELFINAVRQWKTLNKLERCNAFVSLLTNHIEHEQKI